MHHVGCTILKHSGTLSDSQNRDLPSDSDVLAEQVSSLPCDFIEPSKLLSRRTIVQPSQAVSASNRRGSGVSVVITVRDFISCPNYLYVCKGQEFLHK
jgi:hypothetical protein